MTRRSLAGNVALGFLAVAVVLITVAFATPSWLVSDYRITGARLDRMGLWTHCFRSLPDPQDPYQRRFFVGCRWLYDPFTTGYDEIRGYLMPGFLWQHNSFSLSVSYVFLICAVLSLMYFLCCGPDMKQFYILIFSNATILLVGGISAAIAVIVFGSNGNRPGWMPGHTNNFFGWSYILACIGTISCIIAASLFFVDAIIQQKKRDQLKDSQARFGIEYKI